MRNFVQPGDVLKLTAPAGGVVSGNGYLIGAIFCVAAVTAAAADDFEGQVTGVFGLAKTSAQAWAEGQLIYWDAANSRADTSPGVGPLIGVVSEAAANPSSTGRVRLNGGGTSRAGAAGGVAIEGSAAPTSKATAGPVTLTAAEVLSGILVVDCAGAGRTYTLPTAALLAAAVPGAKVGDLIKLYVVNGSDAAETITLAAGAGGGWDANQTASSRVVVQNDSKMIHIRLTNVTAAAEAYVVYA